MSEQTPETKRIFENPILHTITVIIIGVLALDLIVLVHEFGHFFACQMFGVETNIFSIGFGPALFKIKLFNTTFQISAIPLGGYVEPKPESFAIQPYLVKAFILMAGIINNILFAYGITTTLKLFLKRSSNAIANQENNTNTETQNKGDYETQNKTDPNILRTQVQEFVHRETNGRNFIGPFGIINLLGKSALISLPIFCILLATISLNVGVFNLLPIPPLDGGELLLTTIRAIIGPLSPQTTTFITSILIGIFLMLLFLNSLKSSRSNS